MRAHVGLRLLAALQASLRLSPLLLPGLVFAAEPTPTDSPAPTEQPSDPPTSDPTFGPTTDPTPPPSVPDPTEEPTAAPSQAVAAPTISSDKADYAPGELVTLTGGNWAAGESVHIYVNDEKGSTWSRDVDVTADGSGQVGDTFALPDWFISNYVVIATGAQSGMAMTAFTDGNIKVKSAGGRDFNCTVRGFTGSTNCSTGGGSTVTHTADVNGQNESSNNGDSVLITANL